MGVGSLIMCTMCRRRSDLGEGEERERDAIEKWL